MAQKEIEATLDHFYYPLKAEIEQCRANGTIINKENLQKFENEASRYATVHTEDSFKRCYNDPEKDNAMERLFYLINSDIRDYEEILNELTERSLTDKNSLKAEENEELNGMPFDDFDIV